MTENNHMFYVCVSIHYQTADYHDVSIQSFICPLHSPSDKFKLYAPALTLIHQNQ